MSTFLSYSCRWGRSKINMRKYNYLEPLYTNGILRCFSQKTSSHDPLPHNAFVPFMERISMRRSEAKRSIIVQVQSAQSFKELHTYCSSLGSVNHMFHYTTGIEPMHFIIVEFASESDVNNVLTASSHLEENLAVPTQSHFLWFRASNRKLGKLKPNTSVKLGAENSTEIIGEDKIKEILAKCENVSDQMRTLHRTTKLNVVGTRLRFLTALQLENSISGMFPYACTFPFGSTVNGFGKMGSDLDLVLRLVNKKNSEDSRLIFHCKSASGSERMTNQRQMESVGDLIHLFLPGCSHVRRILQARVPIIKYHQQFTDVECDLSMTNMSGVYMSDFLYIMGELDDRVRPLTFTIRKWAKAVGLTNSSPGRWITNFSLTLLVLAFLQRLSKSKPVLPTLNVLKKMAGPDDKYMTEDGIDCTFLRNLDKFDHKITNTDSLESLLNEFFEFYSLFDFSAKAVCLNEATAMPKPDFSAMYIINPLERGLNVSRNVSVEEVERFKVEIRNAAWALGSQDRKSSKWGLLSMFERNKQADEAQNFTFSTKPTRIVNVSALFDEEKIDKNKVEYKNEDVQKEVRGIKLKTRKTLKTLNNNIKEQNRNR